ncbi:MAG: cysteine hydrolase family protein [Elusimicrobiaceae bacterium]
MKRALLVIDVQNEYFTGKMPVTYPMGSLSNIMQAMHAATERGIPVYLIRHTAIQAGAQVFLENSPGWQIVPAILNEKHDKIIEKNLPGSFTGTELEQLLRSNGTDTVTVCGYMTQMCCDTTARQALHLGFAVEFLSDATGTLDVSNSAGSVCAKDLHNAILVTQAMLSSKVVAVRDWMKSL